MGTDTTTSIYYFIHLSLKITQIQKQLKKWRFTLARLQSSISTNYIYQPSAHNIREWHVRAPIYENAITYRPRGFPKRQRAKLARTRLLRRITHFGYEATSNQNNENYKENLTFDSDSYPIMVDNGASYSITNDLRDFIEPPVQKGIKINGFDGSKTSARTGTVQWKILDDDGKPHTITLPGTNYVPTAETRMLSPQHWSQATNDLRGTLCTTYGDLMVLKWNKKNYRKSFPICPRNTKNVGIMMSAAGNQQYNQLCNQYDDSSPLAFACTIDFSSQDATAPTIEETNQQNTTMTKETNKQHPLLIEFNDDLDAMDHHPTFNDNIQEYMHWHYRLNHASFNTMYNMARLKLLPQQVSSFIKTMHKTRQKPPLCNDCTCAKACRKQWRQKPTHNSNPPKELKPGDVVSVDQLISSTPGLVACLHGGRPTHERYKGSTIFVDQASDFTYIYHHTELNSTDTVRAKLAFEAEAARHGVTIKHYHADNGLFRSKPFQEALHQRGQTITFTGVGAHHQNGIAEKRIGDLTRRATTLLLHAQRRWPDAITTHLWPYALRCANESRNTYPTKTNDMSPLNRFSKTTNKPSYRHQHHFGCPVYVLQKNIQDGQKPRKWEDRTRIGINLGPSPQHASSVALILNLETGLVSPQFHCSYDDLFESTTGTQARSIPKSKWQKKCGFLHNDNTDSLNVSGSHEDQTSQSEPTEATRTISPDDQNQHVTPAYITRSGRPSRPPDRLAFKALTEPFEISEEDAWLDQHPLAFKAKSDPDSMYYHQAIQQPDKEEFKKAMRKELTAHHMEGNYKLVKKSKIPKGALLLPPVWQLRRKRITKTGEISKWKARLCIDGSRQKQGIHYEETYAPVVSWGATRFFLTLATKNNWKTRQLDFVMAFTQADVERELYMELPKEFFMPGSDITHKDRNKYALKLVKNLYGQKQAGKVWYEHLKERLVTLGFTRSRHDECVFYYGSTIFLVYTDDTILLGPNPDEIEEIVKLLNKNFRIEDQGTLNDYLGVNIEKREDGKLEMTQPTLISSILKDVGLDDPTKGNPATSRTTPAYHTVILSKDEEGENHSKEDFDYRQVIGKLLYLEKSTRPDIACSVHQCARFCAAPKSSHAQAVKRICRYLLGTRNKGLILDPKEDSFDCWVDASHASEWSSKGAENDPNTARSRMGYAICYAGCPMLWASKMQTEIALSSTEAEYIALSQSMRETLPLMWLLEEVRQKGITVDANPCKIHCKIFEDNEGAIEIAKVPKMRPRTKHLNIKYHHFREEVRKGNVSIYHVRTEDQMADMLTKPLEEATFETHRRKMMGW